MIMFLSSCDLRLQSVIVKSIERNAANLHEARRRLLGAMNESPAITSSLQDPNINGNAGLTSLGKECFHRCQHQRMKKWDRTDTKA